MNTKIFRHLRALGLAAALAGPPAAAWSQQADDAARAQHAILGQNASGSVELRSRVNNHPRAQWFPKAGLGLFVHMGISAVHGGIDLSWGMYANKSWEDGTVTPNAYWALADKWNPKAFRPREWVKKARKAGFKYVVLVTKHHDGYTMWPSKYGTLGVRQKLKGRDLVREFVDACRKNGLKVGLYYSPPDWLYDVRYINWDYSGRSVLDADHRPIDRLPAKPAGHDEKRRELVRGQVRELLTQYGPIDMLWFDGGHGEIANEEVRRLQPGIIINRRNGEMGDYGDSEGVLPTRRFKGWFEANDPCWPARWWSFSASDRMDRAGDVIEKLVIMRAWGGNLLANVGPRADGAMPEEALQAWKEMGDWMKHSGESVFDTEGGNFPERSNIPVTRRGQRALYAHVFPNFHATATVGEVSKRPRRATLLRTGEPVDFTYEDGRLSFCLSPKSRTRMVDTVKFEF